MDDEAHRKRAQQIAQLQRNANFAANLRRHLAANPELCKELCQRVIARLHEMRAADARR
jgi:hypothetical protein